MRLSRLVPRIDLRRAPSSLAVQILALFVFATLVPLAVGFIQTSDDLREAQERALDNAWQVADAASSEIEGIISFALQADQALSGLPAFWNGSDTDRDQILTVLADSQTVFSGLSYVAPDLQQVVRWKPVARRIDLGLVIVDTSQTVIGGQPEVPRISRIDREDVRSGRQSHIHNAAVAIVV